MRGFLNNCAVIVGNLAGEPELRFTQGGTPYAKVTVAVDEKWTDSRGDPQQKAHFLRCVAWKNTGRNLAESLHKGDRVLVVGRFQQRSQKTRHGHINTIELNIESIGPDLAYATATVSKNPKLGLAPTSPSTYENDHDEPHMEEIPLSDVATRQGSTW